MRTRIHRKYQWIVSTSVGPIAVGPPCMPIPGDLPLSDSDDTPVWTARSTDVHPERGEGYSTWGEVRSRGYRFNSNEQF